MSHPLSGRVLDHRYAVREPHGGDSGATVLPVFDRMLQREVAIHLPDAGAGEEARRRFHRDSRLAARVRHPNVLEIFDFVRVDGAEAHEEDGAARELVEVEVAPVPLNSDEMGRQLERMYPPLLREAGVSGLVHVRFRIDASGAVVAPSVRVVKSTHPQFADATRRAVRVLRFEPARAGGEPVAVWVELPVQWTVSR